MGGQWAEMEKGGGGSLNTSRTLQMLCQQTVLAFNLYEVSCDCIVGASTKPVKRFSTMDRAWIVMALLHEKLVYEAIIMDNERLSDLYRRACGSRSPIASLAPLALEIHSGSRAGLGYRRTVHRLRDFSRTHQPQRFNSGGRHAHTPVGSVAVCRWVPGSLGCLRRTWRANASDRAGEELFSRA
ncbi:tRNA pseudouridine synthase A [Dissostichus eleginoides]|uniref:tRNA pseudouridine synthase A n=1 Tax=Dissostichus eleginoides TaxID=100907 RepID=A0AAD9CJM0_DISEL|nr:tRNA pseudouridine synthase A [Dissostichus eleginoides]